MPDLLLELFSEEIPARMQARAERDLHQLMADGLAAGGLTVGETETMSGPRRVVFIAKALPRASAATMEERKGPRVGAPDKAIAGFLKAAGIASLDACKVVSDAKGDYYVARAEKPGRDASAIVAEVASNAVRAFPWPKSMRWGGGRLRWVRPLHSIVCLLDEEPVVFEVDGVPSGAVTKGHRFMSGNNSTIDNSLTVNDSESYTTTLMHARVVSTRRQRAKLILEGAKKIAADFHLALVEDHGLLEENAGLVEWPVVLSGRFDEAFLNVPQEILMTAMRSHQKYFSLREPDSGKLANRFILVSNLEAEDGGAAIVAGNERVIRARLSDAEFFWCNDVATPLADLVPKLSAVTFHEKLGTQLERVTRIMRLAREIAPIVGADPDLAERAANLCKADLMSGTVGEFPELQGVIGRYIALVQGEDASVAEAIAEHYKPQGPTDRVPSNPVAIAVALADKLDMLVGFWAIDEKPTGSKDPFALRRAALGVIRIVLENKLRVLLIPLLETSYILIENTRIQVSNRKPKPKQTFLSCVIELNNKKMFLQSIELLDFFSDRLKVYLREKGERHDLIDAVFALPLQDDLQLTVRRVEALGQFLQTDDGASLLAFVRRALNILKIEEKKDGHAFEGKPALKLLKNREEKALAAVIRSATKDVEIALAKDDFQAAMSALAQLRGPVDVFFETVTVNADDHDIRDNRLKVLATIRALTLNVADFSKIEG